MARARNIKPGFFKNEVLAECSPLGRILFAGLWCEADRSGRLEDRPKRIKIACLPYDDCDVDYLLNELAKRGFILRYVVDSTPYIQVLEFSKHQNPHIREVASSIPSPDEHCASTVLAQFKHGTSPADSLNLIPSSLIPDSIQELHAGIEDSCPTLLDGLEAEPEKPKRNAVPYAQIVNLYHETLPMLPKVEKLTDARKGYLSARWHEDLTTLDEWRNFFDFVGKSTFLTGRAEANGGKRPFRADLEWITRPGNFAKIAEEKYHG